MDPTRIIYLVLFSCCALAYIAIWKLRIGSNIIAAPFVAFALFDVVATWPTAFSTGARDLGFFDPALVTAAGFLAFSLTLLVSAPNNPGKNAAAVRFRDSPIRDQVADRNYGVALLATTVFLIVLGTFQYSGPPPVLKALGSLLNPARNRNALNAIATQREEFTKGYVIGGEGYKGQGAISQILQVGWPFVVITAMALYARRRRPIWLIAAGGLFLLGAAYVGGVGERSHIVMISVAVLFAASYLVRIHQVHVILGACALLALIFFIAPLSPQLSAANTAQDQAAIARDRVLVVEGENNLRVMQLHHEGRLPYQWGKVHWEKIVASLPGKGGGVPFALRLSELRSGASRSTYSSLTYFGAWYADFGPLGVVVGYAIAGVLANVAENSFRRRRKTVLSLPVISLVSIAFVNMAIGSLVGGAVTVLTIMAVYAFLWVLLALQPRGNATEPSRKLSHARTVTGPARRSP
jgi:hypothetical protein